MSELRQRYEQLLQRPEVRSLLNTIRYAEGTPGEAGYRTMFGGGKFDTSKGWKHPDTVVKTSGYASAAAGAYQFLPGTWQGAASALGLPGFDPKSQDLAALHLIDKKRGALDAFLKGEKFGTVLNKLAPEWASLPTTAGKSYYGQPVKKLEDLYKYYEQQKQQIAGQKLPTPQTQQTGQTKQTTGGPNINIILTGGAKPKDTNIFQDFLEKFTRKAFAQPRSNVPSPMDISQQMLNIPPTDYFS